MNRNHRGVAATVVVAGVFLAAGCGGGDDGDDGGDTVHMEMDPEFFVAASIAKSEGMFEGVDVDVKNIGYESSVTGILTGKVQMGSIAPIEVAGLIGEGEDVKYISTAGASQMVSGVAISAGDGGVYSTINDLEGKTLGIPGFGTGTWQTFAVFAKEFYGIDVPEEYFEIVTGDSAALLALLEKGDIDAALLFNAESMAAQAAPDKFDMLFTFRETLEEETGQPMIANGTVASTEWLEGHQEEVDAVVAGLDEAVRWISDHPEEMASGGKYHDLVEDAGWTINQDVEDAVLAALSDGVWLQTSDAYTDEWRSAIYTLVEAGEGTLVKKVPAPDAIWWTS